MGRTVWNPVLVSIAAAPSFAWELLEQIQQQLQPTPLFFSLSLHLHVSIVLSSRIPLLSLSFYLWYFGISFLSSRARLLPLFPSVVVLSFSAPTSESPGIRALQFSFLLLFYFPHYCVFHITIHILSYSVSFYLENYCRENGDFTSGRVLFLDQIFLGRPVPRERESLPALLTSSNKKIHILEHVYKPLSSLYVCVSVFLWPLGVCVEWDVTGSLPCSTHKSNSTCFFLLLVWHDAPGCPRYTLQHYRVCVWYTQALVLDRPYMPPSNPSCTHTHLKAKED